MHVNNTRSIIAGLLLLVLFVTVSCAQEAIVRDPVPEVKVSRSNFIRGIIDATSSGMITDEVKTAIRSFVNIYNANQENSRLKISDDYKIYYSTKDHCYHVVDGDLDISVDIQGAGIAHAYIDGNEGIGEDGRADAYKALIKSFQKGGYIPESVVADMAKIQAKSKSIGKEGKAAFDKMQDALDLIDGGTLVDTGVDYTVPDVSVSAPVVDTSGLQNYGLWLDLDKPINEEIEQKTLEKPTITTPAPLATFDTQPRFTFAPIEHGTIPSLPNVTPAPSPNAGVDMEAAGKRQALTSATMSDEALASWNNAKAGIEDGKNILLTPGTPTDTSNRSIGSQGGIADPQSLLDSLPDISQKLPPAATPRK